MEFLTDSDDDFYENTEVNEIYEQDKQEQEHEEYNDDEIEEYNDIVDDIINNVIDKWKFPKAIKVNKKNSGKSIEYTFRWNSPDWLNNQLGYYIMYIPYSYNCNILWEFIWDNCSHKNGRFNAKVDNIMDVLDQCRNDILKHHNKKLIQYEKLRA